ncbi:MAG TPA: alpha/beta fold hydrolase [Actinomycetota bacterium]|nr:alpha/beta fold hydrolase [Actinomycetota bacterium]
MPETTIDGLSLAYRDTGGPGRIVLLVHAFPFDGRMWDGQVARFGDRQRLLVPDLPGFGDSSVPDDPAAYSIDAYADHLAALLDDAGARDAVVCGVSMGGYVALALWRRHRARVAALVLADTRAGADTPEVARRRAEQQETIHRDGITAVADATLDRLLSERAVARDAQLRARTRALMEQPAAGYVGALEAMRTRHDATADVAGVDAPALVIVGEDDVITPPDEARRLHEAIRGSQLVVIPAAGHLPNLEAPDEFDAALAGFLARL